MDALNKFDDDAGTLPPSAPVVKASKIPNGFYTLTFPDDSHKTFRIHTKKSTSKFAPGKRVFSLLIGPDNTADYEGQGFVDETGIHVWKQKRGGQYNPSKIEQYAAIVWSLAVDGESLEGYELLVSKRCLRCNRLLTDDVSISLGIGPTCRSTNNGD